MNKHLFFVVFILICFFLVTGKTTKKDDFVVLYNYCQPYDDKGIQCPYRIHYQPGIKGNKPPPPPPKIKNECGKAKIIDPTYNVNPKVSLTCSGNRKLDFNNLVEGKHYNMVFDKYPVMRQTWNHNNDKCD